MNREPQPREPWHIKREIQLGHLLTTLTIAVGAVTYISRIDQRIALLEEARIVQRDRDQRQDQLTAESVALLRRQLEQIDGKIDLLVGRAINMERRQ